MEMSQPQQQQQVAIRNPLLEYVTRPVPVMTMEAEHQRGAFRSNVMTALEKGVVGMMERVNEEMQWLMTLEEARIESLRKEFIISEDLSTKREFKIPSKKYDLYISYCYGKQGTAIIHYANSGETFDKRNDCICLKKAVSLGLQNRVCTMPNFFMEHTKETKVCLCTYTRPCHESLTCDDCQGFPCTQTMCWMSCFCWLIPMQVVHWLRIRNVMNNTYHLPKDMETVAIRERKNIFSLLHTDFVSALKKQVEEAAAKTKAVKKSISPTQVANDIESVTVSIPSVEITLKDHPLPILAGNENSYNILREFVAGPGNVEAHRHIHIAIDFSYPLFTSKPDVINFSEILNPKTRAHMYERLSTREEDCT